jgi:hypothetical protein
VNCNELDESEKNALKELKNNKYNIPLIVVFTNAQNNDDIENAKNQIEELFPGDDIFIKILGVPTEDIEKFGLDELLNKTLDIIEKNTKKSKTFEMIRKECINFEKNNIKQMFSKNKEDAVKKIVHEFINNYTSIKDNKDFEMYIFELIKLILKAFSGENEANSQIDDLIKNTQIANFIQSCIKFYSEITKNYIDKILEEKSYEFLDLQVNIENTKKESIRPENKKNKKGFQDFIIKFLSDNFYYIAQKYLIYRYIFDIFEDLTEKSEKISLKNIEDILEGDNLNIAYRNMYLKIFRDLKIQIDKYRDKNNKIYS